MRVALPSGHYAEFRDTLMRGDVRDARKGMIFVISPDGSRTSDGSFLDTITGRLITRMLVEWDLGTKPSECGTDELAQRVLDGLADDDYAELEKAVGPWVERLIGRGKADVYVHVPTGIRFELAAGSDAGKLDGNPDFTREDGPDPKSGSGPTAISS